MIDDQQLSRRILSGTCVQVGARIWSAGCSLAALLIIDRSLSALEFGIYSSYFPLFVIAGTAVDFGSFQIAVREISREPAREEQILRIASRFRLLVAALLTLAIGSFALLRESELRRAGWLLLVTGHLFGQALAVYGAHFHARFRFAPPAVAQGIGGTVFLGGAWWWAGSGGARAEQFLGWFGLGLLLQGLVVFALARRGGLRVRGPVDQDLTRSLVQSMLPLGVGAAFSSAYFWMDSLILREMLGEEAVASYNHAYRLLSFSLVLPIYFGSSLFPLLARLGRTAGQGAARRPGPARVVARATTVLGCVVLPAAALAPFLSQQVLELVWGESDPEATRSLNILAIAAICIYFSYPRIFALIATGWQRDCTLIAVTAGCFKLGLSWVLISTKGIHGAALAALSTEALVLVLVTITLHQRERMTGFSSGLLRPAAVALGLGGLFHILSDSPDLGSLPVGLGLLIVSVFLGGALPLDLKVEVE